MSLRLHYENSSVFKIGIAAALFVATTFNGQTLPSLTDAVTDVWLRKVLTSLQKLIFTTDRICLISR